VPKKKLNFVDQCNWSRDITDQIGADQNNIQWYASAPTVLNLCLLTIERNSSTLTSDNLEILINQYLRSTVSKQEVSHFTRKISINKRDRPQGHVQSDLQEYLQINCLSISWSLVSYSINFFCYNDSRKHTREPW